MKTFINNIFGPYYLWLAKEYNQYKTYIYSRLHPYHYDASRYKDTFLANTCKVDHISTAPVERVIYIFWTGDNEITPNRMNGIHSLEKVAGINVKLITPKNLSQYIKDDDPLPEAFQYLSLNHKSDYLRSYFMHHYGGGYADIKTFFHSWKHAFDLLDASTDAYATGYPEVGFWGPPYLEVNHKLLGNDLYYHWRYLIGNGAFVCRPYTPLTYEWHVEAKRRLEVYAEQLKQHPATDIFGRNEDYPLRWPMLQSSIFHPLCLKYHDHLLKDKALMPSFKNYR